MFTQHFSQAIIFWSCRAQTLQGLVIQQVTSRSPWNPLIRFCKVGAKPKRKKTIFGSRTVVAICYNPYQSFVQSLLLVHQLCHLGQVRMCFADDQSDTEGKQVCPKVPKCKNSIIARKSTLCTLIFSLRRKVPAETGQPYECRVNDHTLNPSRT
jgi:hypothetical protein